METVWKLFRFLLWILSGILVLPCVYVATIYFPKWEKWGEGF